MTTSMNFPTVSDRGVVTHVMVPVDEYARLTGEHPAALKPPTADEVNAAIAVFQDTSTKWHDAEAFLVQVIRDGVEAVRRDQGLTQADLGKAVGLSQPQVSRIEKNPDIASLGALRRIAAALASIAPK